MSSNDGPSNSTRQKLDVPLPEVPTTSPLQSVNVNPQPQQPQPPTSPEADQQAESSAPVDTTKAASQPTRDDADATPSARVRTPTALRPPEPQTNPTSESPAREPGEMTPQPTMTPVSGPSGSGPGPSSTPATRPPPPSNHYPPQPICSVSPYMNSSSLGNGDFHLPRRRDHDVNRLMRELWDTRRQLTAMQAREQVILDDLEKIGARPESTGADRNGVSRDGAYAPCAVCFIVCLVC